MSSAWSRVLLIKLAVNVDTSTCFKDHRVRGGTFPFAYLFKINASPVRISHEIRRDQLKEIDGREYVVSTVLSIEIHVVGHSQARHGTTDPSSSAYEELTQPPP